MFEVFELHTRFLKVESVVRSLKETYHVRERKQHYYGHNEEGTNRCCEHSCLDLESEIGFKASVLTHTFSIEAVVDWTVHDDRKHEEVET